MKRSAKVLYVMNKSLVEPIPRFHGLDQVRSILRRYRRPMEVISFESRGDGAFGAWISRIALYKLREEIRRFREAQKAHGRKWSGSLWRKMRRKPA